MSMNALYDGIRQAEALGHEMLSPEGASMFGSGLRSDCLNCRLLGAVRHQLSVRVSPHRAM